MRGGRGGRGGRGQGTTRRYGRGNYIQEFIRNSLEDIGDVEGYEDDKSPPRLYPFINLPSSPNLSAATDDDKYTLRKNQDLTKWCII